jgi:hypothetical protein
MALQPGEDREFHNQFTEFLKKNLPIEEVPKIESLAHHREMKKQNQKKKKKKSKLEYFIN